MKGLDIADMMIGRQQQQDSFRVTGLNEGRGRGRGRRGVAALGFQNMRQGLEARLLHLLRDDETLRIIGDDDGRGKL